MDHHKIEEENISATQQGWAIIKAILSLVDNIKVSNLPEVLSRLSSAILYIRKLQTWTCIAPKYYDEIAIKPGDSVNKAKIYEARIDP